MQPEAQTKKRIKEILNKHRVYYFMPRGTGFGTSGVPDFVCCCNGKFLAVEAKAAHGRVSPLQKLQIENIRTAKGTALVVYDEPEDYIQLEQAIQTLKELDRQ